jgi:hypothetical protein
MTHLVIGKGEVGTAISKIFNCEAIDKNNNFPSTKYDIIHICFPYYDEFEEDVKNYQKVFNPTYTIIHSTLPVGTSRKLNAIHSPIRGIHPNLEEGIRTFVKFLGGEQASEVASEFKRAGLKIMLFDNPETTEALKLFDTEYYRTCIEFAHRVKNYCNKMNLNYSEVYRLANITYNQGYTELGHEEFVRPVLQPIMTKEIGGHCVMPNSKLIKLSE